MKLTMVGIIVKDMKQSIDFYELIGFSVEAKYSEDYVELVSDSVRISLNNESMIESVYGFKPNLSGERLELAFELGSKEEISEVCSVIESKGHKVLKKLWLAPWNQYYALILDPNGNILSLFANA